MKKLLIITTMVAFFCALVVPSSVLAARTQQCDKKSTSRLRKNCLNTLAKQEARCDDLNSCTTDSRPRLRCVHKAVSDGTACTGGVCQSGVCEISTPTLDAEPIYGDCGLDSIIGPSNIVIGDSQVYQVLKKNFSASTLVCHTDIQIKLIEPFQSGGPWPGAGLTRIGSVEPGATSSSRVDFSVFVNEDFQWVPGLYEIFACTYSLGFLNQQTNSTGIDDNEANRCQAVRFSMTAE